MITDGPDRASNLTYVHRGAAWPEQGGIRRRWVGLARHSAAATVFCAVPAYLFSDAWLHLRTSLVGGRDAKLFTWFFAWDWYALTHLQNPLFSDRVAFPDGANLMWNTSTLVWGALLAPVTGTLGPAASVTLTAALGFALSGYTTHLLARDWGLSPVAALGSGLLFELCPFMYNHAFNGHLQMTLGAALLPLLALFVARLATNRGSPLTTGLLLGICLVVELLTSEELLAGAALVFAIGLLLAAIMSPWSVRSRLPVFVPGSGVAVLVFVGLAAWPLSSQFLGPQNLNGRDIQGDFGGAAFYSLDVANLVVPTSLQWLSPPFLEGIASKLAGEPTGYLGVPMLLLLAWVAVAFRSDRRVRWLIATAIAATVLALGSHPHMVGQSLSVALPLGLVDGVSLMQNLLPDRLTVFVYLAVAILVGRVIDWCLQLQCHVLLTRWLGVAAVVACVATLLPAQRLAATAVDTPAYLQHEVPRGSAVLVFPYTSAFAPDGMYWSADSGVRYRFVGGYIVVPDPTRPHGALFAPLTTSQSFWSAVEESSRTGRAVDEAVLNPEREELRAYGVQYVVLATQDGPLATSGREQISRLLAGPPVNRSGTMVWTVRSAGLPHLQRASDAQAAAGYPDVNSM